MRVKRFLKGLGLGCGLMAFAIGGGPALAGPMGEVPHTSSCLSQDCRIQNQMQGQEQNRLPSTSSFNGANGTMPSANAAMPSCDPFHLGQCMDQESCETAGGHWFDDSCHRYAPVDMQECLAQAEARHYRNGDPLMDPALDRHQVRAQKATIVCELMVPPEDQGKEAMLAMFAFCPDHPEWGWMDLSDMLNQKRIHLAEKVRVGMDVDLSSLAGMRFHLCGGYLTEDGTIGYHCFEVDVEE